MPKTRSKIIKDLIMNKINVLQAMQSLYFMLEDIDDLEINNWVNNEMNGYAKDTKIPEYRKVNTILIGDVQVGYTIYNNVNIPIADEKAYNFFSSFEINDPISALIKMAEAENESEEHSLYLDANTLLVDNYKSINGTVIRARRKLSIYSYNNILSIIKDKVLDIFKLLEYNYGNLDELYIDFSDVQKKEVVLKEIIQIVYNDNSISIGDSNKINDSIVGDNNEN
ncbi:hypothetical protein [Massilimicrobiota sp. An80]|uniref:AbiTii domain-containing protein n=1 Tax=Massilimicrobiota sp. An80 TaxID=1965658 RepID=UPI000B45492C|nr:hypothetical protein [Massilimicrobiota sp. An80]OUN31763.1 hypothetical protein B5G32_12515 [Massilimicrobiota sp. An80]